jgi:signal transduction histidine kinase/CheY-like chemotaxis protein
VIGIYDVAFLACRPFDVPEWTAMSIWMEGVGGFFLMWLRHGRLDEGICCLFIMTIFGHILNMLGFVLLRKYSILDSLSSELKKASEVKSMFVSNVSHEFRSPLLSLTGSTEILKDSTLSDDQMQQVETIDACANILLKLIDDILVFSKLSYEIENKEDSKDNNSTVSAFDFKRCMNHVKSIADTYSQKWGVVMKMDIDSDIPEILCGNAIHLQQVLLNVLTNAAKYSPENGTVDVKITKIMKPQAGDVSKKHLEEVNNVFIQFEVKDHGLGIPEQKKKLLFQPFAKLDTPHVGNYPSTGLGLAITRRMVHSLGGTISFSSSTDEQDHGTIFFILLPFLHDGSLKGNSALLNPKMLVLSNLNDHNDEASEVFIDQCSFCNIVIAEDNPINASVIAKLLRQDKDMTFNIVTVGNGLELVDYVTQSKETTRPHIVLTDHHMPFMTGVEAATLLRAKYKDLKIVLLTGDTSLQSSTDKSIDKVLLKPVKGAVLRRCIRELMASV